MIFLEMSNKDLSAWIEKHSLAIAYYNCPKCKVEFQTCHPFAMRDFNGLQTKVHDCGPNYWTAVLAPRNPEDKKLFYNLI